MAAQDGVGKTLIVAALLSLVCSVVVSYVAVTLRPIQESNKLLDKRLNILKAANLYEEGVDPEQVFGKQVKAKLIDLKSGQEVPGINPEEYDQYAAEKIAEERVLLAAEDDWAGIRVIARYAVVYELEKDGAFDGVVLPVHGKGLWSTLYGFLAIEADGNTVSGLRFYEHAETPGLGGEVDNPRWLQLWPGKKIKNDEGTTKIEVIKGMVDPASAKAEHQIDGLAGATITARGVSDLVRFWLGSNGFGPYLQRLAAEKEGQKAEAS